MVKPPDGSFFFNWWLGQCYLLYMVD